LDSTLYYQNTVSDLINRMLTVDPSARITLEEVLVHPWMQGPVLSDVELYVHMQQRRELIRNSKRQQKHFAHTEIVGPATPVVSPLNAADITTQQGDLAVLQICGKPCESEPKAEAEAQNNIGSQFAGMRTQPSQQVSLESSVDPRVSEMMVPASACTSASASSAGMTHCMFNVQMHVHSSSGLNTTTSCETGPSATGYSAVSVDDYSSAEMHGSFTVVTNITAACPKRVSSITARDAEFKFEDAFPNAA
jgi:serine/threonine protein kinase